MTMIGNDFPVRANAFCLRTEKRVSSVQMSPAGTLCFDIFSPPPGDSEVISQVDRLSSIETKIAPRSLRIALGASGRSAITCMAVSRVARLQPHSVRAPVAIHPHRIWSDSRIAEALDTSIANIERTRRQL